MDKSARITRANPVKNDNFAATMSNNNFIDISRLIKEKSPRLAKWLPAFIVNYIKRIVHEDEINQFIINNSHLYNSDFCDAIVEYLNIKIKVTGIENIPKEGRVIIAMNHPLGGMDAISFVSAIKQHRKDLRFIVNDLLLSMKNLNGLFLGVNKHGKNELSTRQQITQLFENDEAVCIFPAGLVSRKSKKLIRDLDWKKTFVTYAKKFNQPIIPVYIDGELSSFFYRLANFRKFIGIKVNIEMLYLADELFKQRGKTMHFTVGKPILPTDFDPSQSERKQAEAVREIVYALSNKHFSQK